VSSYVAWGWLSTASPAAKARFLELKQAWAAAPEAGKVAAWTALDRHAQTIASWWGVRNISAALFGLPVGFISIWIVSLLTPAPSQAVMDMVDATRRPRGEAIMQDKASPAMGH